MMVFIIFLSTFDFKMLKVDAALIATWDKQVADSWKKKC